MSKENIHHEKIFITVEPSNKYDKLLIGRLSNYVVLLILLFVQSKLNVDIPDNLFFVFGSAAAGLEIGQLMNLLKRK